MSESRGSIDDLLTQLESKRKRVALYTIIPLFAFLAVIVFVLFYTTRNVRQSLTETERLRTESAMLRGEVAELERRRDELKYQYAEIKAAVEEAAKKNEGARSVNAEIQKIESGAGTAGASPRVFIQITGDAQRKAANAVADALRKLNYIVPEMERVSEAPKNVEVRYFRPEDRETANTVAGALAQAGVPGANVRQLSAAGARPGRLEVWFPADPSAPPPGDKTLAVLQGDFPSLDEAREYASGLKAHDLPYPIEIYRHREGRRFYVTLGGYVSAEEAGKRVSYARRSGLSGDAYASTHAAGDNLYR